MDYVLINRLTIDGKELLDYRAFGEEEVELRVEVDLMNSTGSAVKTPRRKLNLEYVVPASGAELDFAAMNNSVVTAEDDGGGRTTWTGVCCLSVGEAKVDGDNPKMREIKLLVKGKRIVE